MAVHVQMQFVLQIPMMLWLQSMFMSFELVVGMVVVHPYGGGCWEVTFEMLVVTGVFHLFVFKFPITVACYWCSSPQRHWSYMYFLAVLCVPLIVCLTLF